METSVRLEFEIDGKTVSLEIVITRRDKELIVEVHEWMHNLKKVSLRYAS